MRLPLKTTLFRATVFCAGVALSASLSVQARQTVVIAAGPAAKGPAPAKQTPYQIGIAFYNAKRYAEAAQYFNKVVRDEPENSDAYYYLATCHHFLGDKTACFNLCNYIVKYFRSTPAATSADQYLAAFVAERDNPKPKPTPSTAPTAAARKVVVKAPPVIESVSALVEIVRARADRPNVSKEAVTAIKQAVDALPPQVQEVLSSNRVKIFVTPTVEDYSPGVKYQEARGYEGGTYKSCPAFYQDRKIVIAERTMDEGDETIKDAFPPRQMVNSLYHETGHALDFCLDDISHSDDFKHAYLLDSAHVDPSTAQKLAYFLQKSEDGQEECCAELIGTLLGQSERHTAELRTTFPLTLKLLRTKLKL